MAARGFRVEMCGCVWVCVCVYVELLDQHLPWLARRFLEQAYVVAQRLEVG